jgi:hypothetical protein
MDPHATLSRDGRRALQQLEQATETLADLGLMEDTMHDALTGYLGEMKSEYGLAKAADEGWEADEENEDEDEDDDDEVGEREGWDEADLHE